jgi:N-acetyl-anhydromuramyl-L-alanine amidase AmpD
MATTAAPPTKSDYTAQDDTPQVQYPNISPPPPANLPPPTTDEDEGYKKAGAVNVERRPDLKAQADAFKKQQQLGQGAGAQPGTGQPKEVGEPKDEDEGYKKAGAVPVKTEQPKQEEGTSEEYSAAGAVAIPTPTPQGPTTTEQQPVQPQAQPNVSPPPPPNIPAPQTQPAEQPQSQLPSQFQTPQQPPVTRQPSPQPTEQSQSQLPSQFQTQPTDPATQIAALIASGKTAGEAQALVAGQQPKTLAGKTPTPKQQPAPIDDLGKLGDEDIINQALTETPKKPQVTTSAPIQQPQQPESMEAAQKRYETERATLGVQQPPEPSQAPAAPTTAAPDKPVVTMIPATKAYTPSTGRNIQGIVLHSSDGDEKSGIRTLTGNDPAHQVTAHYFVTKTGKIYQFVADGDIAWHAGKTSGQYGSYDNANTIGIEQEHVDGKDQWSDAQVKATASLVAYLQKKYGLTNSNVLGHSDIAPGRKQDPYNFPWSQFQKYVQEGGGAAPGNKAQLPALSHENADVVAQLTKAGLNATRFGYKGDTTGDPESIKGSGKYVEHMKAGYDVALNDAAAKLVGNPKPGDVFTYAGREWRYGDKVPERYADARFDIFDPNGEFAGIGGGGKASGSKGGDQKSPFAGQPLFSIGSAGGGGSSPPLAPQPPHFGGDGGSSYREPPDQSGGGSIKLGGWSGGGLGDVAAGAVLANAVRGGGGQQQSAQPPSPDEPEDPMVTALMKRGFTLQQAQQFAASSQTIAPGKGVPPLKTPGPPPPAPTQLPAPVPKLLSPEQLKPGKVPKIVPEKQPPPPAPGKPLQLPGRPAQQQQPQAKQPAVDPSVVLGLMKRGFTREQAIAFAAKATVTPQQQGPQRPSPAPPPPPSDLPPLRPPISPIPKTPSQPEKVKSGAIRTATGEIKEIPFHYQVKQAGGMGMSPQALANPDHPDWGYTTTHGKYIPRLEGWRRIAAKTLLPQDKVDYGAEPPAAPSVEKPKPQAQPEPTEFKGPPTGSTHGNPNPPGMERLAQQPTFDRQAKHHATLLSPDDPRVKKQKDGKIKGEHFVEGDLFHEGMWNRVPGGPNGRQRNIVRQAEQAIADKTPMHISYISSPAEAALYPTRESRTTQYEAHSPEVRLMGTTTGQLVGHSMIPVAVGITPGKKVSDPHESVIHGISTNVLANNFQHINTKLVEMGRKTPYKEFGTKFANDLQGYLSNLNAGHTGTGYGHAVGTAEYPNSPDENHVPYKLTRLEADFINATINNTGAFAKHEDGQALRRLAEANGTLITPEGETNRLLHDIEQHDPGWSGRGSGKRGRVLEPSIRSFKTGLIHDVHETEEHMPATIRPGKQYQALTKAVHRTSERGRPDIQISVSPRSQPSASMPRDLAHNARINVIEREFSEDRINEAQARKLLEAIGENPDEYQFHGGSGGLITPYEEDPTAITHEEHAQMKDGLKKQWVGGKLPVEDYRRKVAEIPLPTKPSKPVVSTGTSEHNLTPETPKPVAEAPRPPKITVETEPAPKSITPAPKPKPQPVETPESTEQEKPAQTSTPTPPKPPAPDEPLPTVKAFKPAGVKKPEEEPEKQPEPKGPPAPDEPLPEKPAKKPEPAPEEETAPSASHYVSPNVKEGTDLAGAQKQVQSQPHKKARDFYQKVEDAYRSGGGGKVTPTIGNWEGTKEGSSWTHDDNDNLQDARVKAAVKGLHSAQKGTAAFHYHNDGPDRHYDIDFPEHSHEEADKLIAKHGFPASTIHKTPQGLRAHLIDPGGENHEHAKQLAAEAKAKSPIVRHGTAAFDGGDDRESAAEAYRRVLGESGIQIRGRQGGLSLRGHGTGGQHPLQPLYEEAEDNYAQHQKAITRQTEKAQEEAEEKEKEEVMRQAAVDRDNISPEDQAGMNRLNKKAKAVAKQEGGIEGINPLSMHAHLTGQRAFPGKLKNEQIGEYYDANNPRLDYANEEHREHVSHAVYHDIVHSLAGTTTGGKPSTAYGWYNRTVQKSLKKAGEIAPKILTHADHALAWKLAWAITSQGQDVFPNTESTWAAYRYFHEHGRLPESREIFGGGLKAEQMEENFKKINKLWHGDENQKGLGHEKLQKRLMKQMTVGELAKTYGMKVPGELAHHKVNGAMFMGAKIGAFFSNLNGDFDPTTMDLWFSRNMNLMAGNMFNFSDEATRKDRMEKGKLVKAHLNDLKEALDSGMLTTVSNEQAKKMSDELSALMAHPEGQLDRPTAKALAPEIYNWAKERHNFYQQSTGLKGSYNKELKNKETSTAKKLDLGVSELSNAPRNGTEREWWRDIMRRSGEKLKNVGLKLVNADKQALLWFVIKDLFRMAGSPQRDKADYLDATYMLAHKVKNGKLPGLPPEKLEQLEKAA